MTKFEAITAMAEGDKITNTSWDRSCTYIHISTEGNIVDDCSILYNFNFAPKDGWGRYEEPAVVSEAKVAIINTAVADLSYAIENQQRLKDIIYNADLQIDEAILVLTQARERIMEILQERL
jgi:hypothetical protein